MSGFKVLTKAQYIAWKKEGLSDTEVMQRFGCKNKRALLRWKKFHKLLTGGRKFHYLDLPIDEIREQRKCRSYARVARMYGLTYTQFYEWVLRQRKKGVWI